MYSNQYEEYIRSILGYPDNMQKNQNVLYQNEYQKMPQTKENKELEKYYPEIYKIMYPMIKKICKENTGASTEEEIDKMADEIYTAIADNNQININSNNIVNIVNDTRIQNNNELHKAENKKTNVRKYENANRNVRNYEGKNKNVENYQDKNIMQNARNFEENRLKDLIKILLIRELLDLPNGVQVRYPYSHPLQMRPPVIPGNYQPIYDIYEY